MPNDPTHAELQHRKLREYILSGVRTAPVEELARIAPSLTEAELRICTQLQAMAAAPHFSVRVSLRRLAELTGLAHSNVKLAVKALRAAKMLITREGTPTSANAYGLAWCLVTPFKGGPVAGPPPRQEVDSQQAHRWAFPEPTPGPVAGPPPTENKGLTHDSPPLDIDPLEYLIDQVLDARTANFHSSEIETAAATLESWFARWAQVHGFRQPEPIRDRLIIAQLLTAARNFDRLQTLMYDLDAERTKPGIHSPYAWLLTVVMQRFHQVTPAELSARREARKRRGFRVVTPPAPAQLDFEEPGEDPAELIARLAERKKLQ